ncbi:hypothetical protein Q4595_16330 [Wenyingzhuangia sp. 1_MG-2023]|nr:hypothetical protein [Wenyingzhuangia sp. 1_MG-2023]
MKKIAIVFGTLILIFIILISFGLYTLGIEDNYGDLQNLYYKSSDGNLILNRETKDFGIIKKDWKSIRVQTAENKSFDLGYWANQNENQYKIEVYDIEKLEIKNLTYKHVENLIESSKAKFIINNNKR